MKKSYALSKNELQEKLENFYSEKIAPHGIVDQISLLEYRRIRRELSVLLDELAYPVANINYNDEDTEWHDIWDTIVFVFKDVFGNQEDMSKITKAQLLEFKQRLLDELDKMTES